MGDPLGIESRDGSGRGWAEPWRSNTGRGMDERRDSYHHQVGGNMTGRGNYDMDARLRKLKMPVFEGEDAQGWIYRVERYFVINGLLEKEKLMAAALCLEGKALAWLQWMEARYPMCSWEEFRDCMLEHFRVIREGDLHEQFYALKQEGTVMKYRERFKMLSGRLMGISEGLEENFMKGLKVEIRAELRVLRPRGLREMIELAQIVEEKN